MMKARFLIILAVTAAVFVSGCAAQNNQTYQSPGQTGPLPAPQPGRAGSELAAQKISIDSYNPRAVSVRNVGTATIQTSEIKVSIDGEERQCDWDSGTMPPYAVRRCSFSGPECGGGQILNVTAPDNSASVKC